MQTIRTLKQLKKIPQSAQNKMRTKFKKTTCSQGTNVAELANIWGLSSRSSNLFCFWLPIVLSNNIASCSVSILWTLLSGNLQQNTANCFIARLINIASEMKLCYQKKTSKLKLAMVDGKTLCPASYWQLEDFKKTIHQEGLVNSS